MFGCVVFFRFAGRIRDESHDEEIPNRVVHVVFGHSSQDIVLPEEVLHKDQLSVEGPLGVAHTST